MNRETRDKFASGTTVDKTTGNACWETAPEIFAKLNKDFGPFDVDLTADADRALCAVWFGPGVGTFAPDALTAAWHTYGRNGYSNPPYGSFVPHMLRKAALEAARGFTSTLLLPMRVTKAFHQHVLSGASELLFCDKRLIFYENGAPRLNPKTGKPDAAMFDSIVVRYQPGVYACPRVGVWRVPAHGKAASTRRAASLLQASV